MFGTLNRITDSATIIANTTANRSITIFTATTTADTGIVVFGLSGANCRAPGTDTVVRTSTARITASQRRATSGIGTIGLILILITTTFTQTGATSTDIILASEITGAGRELSSANASSSLV
jgi:hypothetical protein